MGGREDIGMGGRRGDMDTMEWLGRSLVWEKGMLKLNGKKDERKDCLNKPTM